MASEIDTKKVTALAKIVKSNPGESETFYVEKSGIERAQILRYLVRAELEADPSLKIPATGAAIVKAREQGVRWPRIAARAGVSEAKAKELFEEKSGTSASESYTGRGRNFAGTAAPAKPKAGKAGKAAPAAGTSGRRGKAAAGKAAPASRTPGRRGTRATADPK